MSRTSGNVSRRSGPTWWVIICLAAAAFFAVQVIHSFTPSGGNAHPPRLAATMKPIDGIPCNSTEQVSYHVHAHLTILDLGRTVTVPAYVGIPYGDCFYWLHTHDTSGVIHVEAPHQIHPNLGEFFDIWGEPLSGDRVDGVRARQGQNLRVWVDGKRYRSNPRAIPLVDHTDITLEVGPPYIRPPAYDFAGNGY